MTTVGILTTIIAITTCICMIISLVINGRIKHFPKFWLICLFGAVICLIINYADFTNIIKQLVEDTSINPLKILVFFISMTIMSIILDKLDFFKFVAIKCTKLAHNSQKKLFFIFYIIVSILTIFTSNDIVILSFIPFICYFCKYTDISPVPYVFSSFVAANTWSMLLIIGNPTNVYLATFAGIDFVSYLFTMALPTLACGVVSLFLLLVLFKNYLKQPITKQLDSDIDINKTLVIVNVIILAVCIIMLAISSYIGLQMWYISLGFVVLQILINIVIIAFSTKSYNFIFSAIKSAPWTLIPFLLSMFLIVSCLGVNNITTILANILDRGNSLISYGIGSFLFSNIMNNIPMTTLFAQIMASGSANLAAVYASIIGSNLGAILTPVGALAGIMFLKILKEKNVDFSIRTFIKYGSVISVISMSVGIGVLALII